MCYQPPGTDICITFESPLMRGRFRWYQSRKLAVGCDPRIETLFLSLSTLELSLLKPFSTQTLTTDCCLFQMADNGWSNEICFAEPGLPKLLLLSLERVGVVDTPEYIYREYDPKGTLRCDLMIFVGKSTRYPDVEP